MSCSLSGIPVDPEHPVDPELTNICAGPVCISTFSSLQKLKLWAHKEFGYPTSVAFNNKSIHLLKGLTRLTNLVRDCLAPTHWCARRHKLLSLVSCIYRYIISLQWQKNVVFTFTFFIIQGPEFIIFHHSRSSFGRQEENRLMRSFRDIHLIIVVENSCRQWCVWQMTEKALWTEPTIATSVSCPPSLTSKGRGQNLMTWLLIAPAM